MTPLSPRCDLFARVKTDWCVLVARRLPLFTHFHGERLHQPSFARFLFHSTPPPAAPACSSSSSTRLPQDDHCPFKMRKSHAGVLVPQEAHSFLDESRFDGRYQPPWFPAQTKAPSTHCVWFYLKSFLMPCFLSVCLWILHSIWSALNIHL